MVSLRRCFLTGVMLLATLATIGLVSIHGATALSSATASSDANGLDYSIEMIRSDTKATSISRQLQNQECEGLKEFVFEIDPIINATEPNTCTCNGGGDNGDDATMMIECKLKNGCILTRNDPKLSGVNGNYMKSDYEVTLTKVDSGDGSMSSEVQTCFTYPTRHGQFSDDKVCITLVYGGDGGGIDDDTSTKPMQCNGIAINDETCNSCEICDIPVSDEDGGDADGSESSGFSSILFDCTNFILDGSGQKNYISDVCHDNNAQNSIIQFTQNRELIIDTTGVVECSGPGGGDSSAAVADTNVGSGRLWKEILLIMTGSFSVTHLL